MPLECGDHLARLSTNFNVGPMSEDENHPLRDKRQSSSEFWRIPLPLVRNAGQPAGLELASLANAPHPRPLPRQANVDETALVSKWTAPRDPPNPPLLRGGVRT